MVPTARWLLVLAVAVGLVGAPVAVRAWPVEPSAASAADVAAAVRAAGGLGWSGEVRTQGSVEIPESAGADGTSLDGVARLLGDSSTLRVWWRSDREYRIDRVRPSGETDVVRDGGTTVQWRYEGGRARFTPYSSLRLPDDPDLVPVALARRMLSGVGDEELRRLRDERIAGRAAAGLRVAPADPRSTIDRVDLWADQESGLPLRVEVYAAGQDSPALVTEVTDLDLRRPTPRQTALDLGLGVEVGRGGSLDPEGTAGAPPPPAELAGLARRPESLRLDVGLYGRGPTALALLPVRDSVARGLREQLRRVRTTEDTGRRQSVGFGPLSVAVTRVGERAYVLVGTVTLATVADAADELEAVG